MTNQDLKILITGPYITNYSLAKVNRNLAVAMSKLDHNHRVRIWKEPSFEIDKLPSQKDLEQFPQVKSILTNDVDDFDVVVMNHYPSSPQQPYGLKDLPGKTKLMYLAWEESVFPDEKVREINENLHGLMVSTTFVKQIMRRNGVTVPIKVVLNSIDDGILGNKEEYPLDTKKSFKFLHISTAKPRKGVDILLEAYYSEFSGDDDVTLIIKSFPGPENIVNDLIGKLNKEYDNPPEVLHINSPDLTEAQIAWLTDSADVSVYPTRGEGFGLPIAESMYLKTPVICTGYSGHLDFIDENSGWLIPFEVKPAIESEATNIGAHWAEPDAKSLAKEMRNLFENKDPESTKKKLELAYESAKQLTAENTAKAALEFIEEISPVTELKQKHLAVLTTMNTVCGIAEYSSSLYTGIGDSFDKLSYLANADVADRTRPDTGNVYRVWEQGEQTFADTIKWIEKNQPDYFHIQMHAAHFPVSALEKLIEGVTSLENRPMTILTPHNVKSNHLDLSLLAKSLGKLDKILIHNQKDLDYLAGAGLSNLELYHHPFEEFPVRSKSFIQESLGLNSSLPIIVSHGLVSEHKGLIQTAEAIARLKADFPQVLWLAVNAVNINSSTSASTFSALRERITSLGIEENVRLFPEFLDKEEVAILLQAADIGVLAYEERGESASGAIRKFLASGTPTIVTNIPMLSELHAEVLKINDNSPEAISTGVTKLFADKNMMAEIKTSALESLKSGNWDEMGIRLLGIYSRLNGVQQ